MSNYPVVLTNTTIRHLFPTPLIISELPPDIVADINPRLKKLILAREQETPSAYASNRGGWQSDDKITIWGGDDVATVIAAFCQTLEQITVHFNRNGNYRASVPWKVRGWANINRQGDSNAPHIHPGAYWSAVYYLSIQEPDDPAAGGDFQMMDPRGGLSLMYCPALRIGIDGYMTAGTGEIHCPREGQCLVFPSWLSHAVTPYYGKGTRMSLAFNFSV